MNVHKISSILIITLFLFMGVACNRNEEPEPYLHLLESDTILGANDAIITLTIESNIEWTLLSNAVWCMPQTATGYGDGVVQVIVSDNDTQAERSAILTLSSVDSALVQQLVIVQQCLTPDSSTHYRLPVIFHVLYQKEGDKRQNVLEGHLATLIDEVNVIYANCGQDLGLEFVMATHDPEGNLLKEPGVVRHKINVASINSSHFMGYGKEPKKYCEYMWDPNRYVNIFVYAFEDKGILGISHFPYAIKPHALEGLSELEYDAPWSELPWPQCVSINNEYIYSHEEYYTITDVVNTLAHELGHFLGLRHSFSEDTETYDRDVCIDSDFCTDTPTYNKSAYDVLMQACMTSDGHVDDEEKEMLMMREDCDTGEEFRSTNIMDYAYTEANVFSPQQAARIRYVLEHSPYVPGPKVRLPGQQVLPTKSVQTNQYVLITFE
jgi:zinc-dependent metalloproteinase lipoprotein